MKNIIVALLGISLAWNAQSQDGPFGFNGKTTIFTGNALHWDATQDASTNLVLSSWSDRYFKINGATFRQNGFVGLGTTSPSAKLHIGQAAGGWADGLRLSLSGKNWDVVSDSNGDRLIIAPNQDMSKGVVINNGNFGVGIGNPWAKLQVNHTSTQAYSNAVYINSSNLTDHWPLVLQSNSNNVSGFYSNSAQDMALILRDRNGNGTLIQSLGNSYLTGGNLGIGTATPDGKLDVRGSLVLETGSNASILTGIGNVELNRYLTLLNSAGYSSASGLKAGGVLVSDSYSYANPSKNDLIVKGKVGIGTPTPNTGLHVVNGGQSIEFLNGSNTSGYSLRVGVNDDGINFSNNSAIRGFNFSNSNGNLVTVASNGNVGIGTGTTSPDAKLAVKGVIHTQEVKVDLTGAVAPDYVFEKEYDLLPLSEVENYINKNKHLPEVPSAKQIEEEGLNLKEMNLILLKKVEELTLHLIEQNKIISQQNERITTLEKRKK